MKRDGFTLVELLIVIALVSFLMAITVPVLHSSRQRAKAVLCKSNIRQLTLGLLMYETEHRTLPFALDSVTMDPPPSGWPGGYAYDRAGWWWFNYIEGFYNNADRKKTILLCPSKRLNDIRLKDNILCGNYGVNLSICKCTEGRRSCAEFIGTPLCTTNLRNPSRTLLIVDSGYSMINWRHVADILPVTFSSIIEDTAYIPGMKINSERTNLWPGQKNDAINGRHPNKTVNVGFADGSVCSSKADELLVEKIGDGYKNRSPLWIPK